VPCSEWASRTSPSCCKHLKQRVADLNICRTVINAIDLQNAQKIRLRVIALDTLSVRGLLCNRPFQFCRYSETSAMLGLIAAHSVSYFYNACTRLSIGKAEVFICFLPKNLFFASPIHPFRASGTFRIVFRRKTILLELELVSYPFLSSYPVLASYLMGVLQHTSPLNVLVCCNIQVL